MCHSEIGMLDSRASVGYGLQLVGSVITTRLVE
jgi:hypothetical protein